MVIKMRCFYIFKINPTLEILTKNNPYELYHTLETIYFRSSDDIYLGNVFVKQIVEPIERKELDISLFKDYKNNYFYMKYKNHHMMNDIYRRENTKLSIYKTYLKLETNVVKPCFLKNLQKNPHLFACDFEEKDYFWLDSLNTGAVFI